MSGPEDQSKTAKTGNSKKAPKPASKTLDEKDYISKNQSQLAELLFQLTGIKYWQSLNSSECFKNNNETEALSNLRELKEAFEAFKMSTQETELDSCIENSVAALTELIKFLDDKKTEADKQVKWDRTKTYLALVHQMAQAFAYASEASEDKVVLKLRQDKLRLCFGYGSLCGSIEAFAVHCKEKEPLVKELRACQEKLQIAERAVQEKEAALKTLQAKVKELEQEVGELKKQQSDSKKASDESTALNEDLKNEIEKLKGRVGSLSEDATEWQTKILSFLKEANISVPAKQYPMAPVSDERKKIRLTSLVTGNSAFVTPLIELLGKELKRLLMLQQDQKLEIQSLQQDFCFAVQNAIDVFKSKGVLSETSNDTSGVPTIPGFTSLSFSGAKVDNLWWGIRKLNQATEQEPIIEQMFVKGVEVGSYFKRRGKLQGHSWKRQKLDDGLQKLETGTEEAVTGEYEGFMRKGKKEGYGKLRTIVSGQTDKIEEGVWKDDKLVTAY